MADFTINSLAASAASDSDTFVKSNDAGVLNKISYSTLKESIVGDDLHSYTYDRVSINTSNFNGYIDFYGCGRIVTFRARITVVTSIAKNTDFTLATLSNIVSARYSTAIRQYRYGYNTSGATFKGCVEFSVNVNDVILRSPDAALAANDVVYISGAYIKQ